MDISESEQGKLNLQVLPSQQEQSTLFSDIQKDENESQKQIIKQITPDAENKAPEEANQNNQIFQSNNEENKVFQNEQSHAEVQQKSQKLLEDEAQPQQMQEELEIQTDQQQQVSQMQEKKKQASNQPFRFEHYLPKRETRSQAEQKTASRSNSEQNNKPKLLSRKQAEVAEMMKEEQLDQKTRGKKNINYKILVNQPQQFGNELPQKGLKAKENKLQAKQQKKNHENQNSLEESEQILPVPVIEQPQKKRGRPSQANVQQSTADQTEKTSNAGGRKVKNSNKDNGNQSQTGNNQNQNGSNQNSKILSSILEGGTNNNTNNLNENSNSQAIQPQSQINQQNSSTYQTEQSKKGTEIPFRSDAPDYLLVLIDNTIERDIHSFLRKKFASNHMDEVVEPSNMITSKVKKHARLQYYLPFEQTKLYQYKEVILESIQSSQSSKKSKKKKSTNTKNKKKIPPPKYQQKNQKNIAQKNELMEQSQNQDDENSQTFTTSQNGDNKLLIQNEKPIEIQVPGNITKQNNEENLDKDCQQNTANSIMENSQNRSNSSVSQNQNNISAIISPQQSQNSNNEEDQMDIEDDDQIDEQLQIQEEIDDNRSDEDIFEEYIDQFTYEDEKRQIEASNLSSYFKQLFLNDFEYQIPLKDFSYSKINYSAAIPELQLNCLTQTKMNSIDAIRARAENNTYYEFQEFDRDMRKLFNYALRFRCKSVQSFQYMTYIIKDYYDFVKKNNSINQIEIVKKKDIHTLVRGDLDNKMQVKKWPIIPTSYRNYIQITEYDPQPPSFENQIKEKLKSKKIPVKCDKKCVCNNFSRMGDFNLETCTWNSKCQNRASRVECIECECKNQQISKNDRQVIGTDVEETLCWGIDLYTKKNIFYILPERYSDEQKNMFIQFQLMKAINLQKDNGWDIIHCCNFILERSQNKKQRLEEKDVEIAEPKFNEDSRKCAKSIIKAIKYIKKALIDQNIDPENLYSEAFRIHTKGMGLICINPKGIEQNEFITEYIGEIFQPWRWFEKQDTIKKYMKENNKRDILPDFWNIMLEIHKDDPKGYDILFVDPILKGNFSSRLSHSCEPNCGTVPTITNTGNYVIAMFAMHPIEYGEELSFDYMAVTESVQEHKRAICLCGSSKCRGRYLELSNSNIKQFNQILEKIHCFLNRTHTLYTACTEELQQEDEEILEQYSFRSNIRENSPKWLQKWAALVLRIINQEYDLFLEELIDAEKKKVQKEESLLNLTIEQINQKIDLPYLKYLAQTRKDARIQNIVISIDKIKYYTQQINDQNPPFLNMQNDQLLENYWIKSENTLKEDLLEVLQQVHSKVINYQLVEYAHIIISNASKKIQIFQKFGQYDHGLLVVRVVVLIISDFFLQMKNCNLQSEALSLILHFHAFTHKYFKTHSYKKFTSEEQIIQKEDIINVELFDEDQKGNMQEFTAFSDKKTYTSLFIWGQLNMWYKQSVTNPATTLSLERRGPLIYPQLSNSFKESSTLYPFVDNKFVENPKQVFMDHLKAKPECYWPGDSFNKWSFKNQMSQYGSFMYDSLCYKKEFPNYIEQVLDIHQKSFKEKIDFLKEVEIKLSGLSMQEIEDIINSVIEDSPESYYEAIQGVKKNVKLNPPSLNLQKPDQNTSAAAEALNLITSKKRKGNKVQTLDEVLDTTKNLKQDIPNQIIQGGNILNNNLISFMQSPSQQAQHQQQQNQLQQNIFLNQQYQQQYSTLKSLDQISQIYQQQTQQQQINQPQQNPQHKQNQQILEQLKNPINDMTKVSPPLPPYLNNSAFNQFQNNLLSQPSSTPNNSIQQGYLNMQPPNNQAAATQQLIQTNDIQRYQQQQHQQVQQQQPQLQQQQQPQQQQQQQQQPQYQQQHHQKLQQHQFQNPNQNQMIGIGSQQIFQNQNQYQQNQQNPHQLIQNQQNSPYLPQQQQNLIPGQPQLHAMQPVNYGIQSQNIYQNQNNQIPLQQMQQNPQQLLQNVLSQPQSQQQQHHFRMQQNYQQIHSQPLIGNSNQMNQQNHQGSKSQQNISLVNQTNMLATYSNQQISKTLDKIPSQQQINQVQTQRISQNDIGSLGDINSQKSLGNIPALQSPAAISGGISPLLPQNASSKKQEPKKQEEKSSAPNAVINNSAPSPQLQQQKQDQKPAFPPQVSLQGKEQQPAQNLVNPQQSQIQQAPNLIQQNQQVQQPNQPASQIDPSRGKNLVINTGSNYKQINFFTSENDPSLLNAQQTLQKQYQQGQQQYQAQYQNPYNPTVSQQLNNTFGLNYFDDPTNLIKYQNYDQLNQSDDVRNRNSSMMSNNSFLSQKNTAGSNNPNPLIAQQIQSLDVLNSAFGNYPQYNLNPNNNFLNQFSMQQNNNFIGQTGYPQGQYNGLDDKVSLKNTPPPTPQQSQFNLYNNNVQQFSQYPTELNLNRTSSYGPQQNMYTQQNTQNPSYNILNQESDFSHRVNSLKSFQQVAPINPNIISEPVPNNYQKNEIASPSSFFEKTTFSNPCNQEQSQNFVAQQLPQLQQSYSRPNQQQLQATGYNQLNYPQSDIYQPQQNLQQAQTQSENTGNNSEQTAKVAQKNIEQNFI